MVKHISEISKDHITQQAEEFDCWALHQCVGVTEEPDEVGLFSTSNHGGVKNEEAIEVAKLNPNSTNNASATDENIQMEIVQLLESCIASLSIGIDSDDANLICNILPGMVDDDNQPLLKNIPAVAEENAANPMEFFMTGEPSGC